MTIQKSALFAESVDITFSMLLLFIMMKDAMLAKFSKNANFQLSEAVLSSKWGRISPEDHCCYQN